MNKLMQLESNIIIKINLITDEFVFNNSALITFPYINKMKFSHSIFVGLIDLIKVSKYDKKELFVLEREIIHFNRVYNQKIKSLGNEIIIYMSDITEQKEMQNEINELKIKLNKLTCERTSKLEKIIDHLKRWLKIERNMIKNITQSLKSTSVGIWTWDIMSDIVFWDETICTILGVKKRSVINPFENAVGVLHPDDKDRIINEIKLSTVSKEPIETEFKIITSEGNTNVVYTKGKFDLDLHGNLKSMTGICVDMTRQRKKNKIFIV